MSALPISISTGRVLVADGVVYVPVVNLPSEWKTPNSGLGGADFAAGKGELLLRVRGKTNRGEGRLRRIAVEVTQ